MATKNSSGSYPEAEPPAKRSYKPRRAKLELYRGINGFYWRLRSSNGRIICIGGEKYDSKEKLLRTLKRIPELMLAARAYDLTKRTCDEVDYND
jgi:uncharacterized protein YegP (UPF0339 family)